MKVCFIGSEGVGKTSLILRYTKNTFSNSYLATIGCDFYEVDFTRDNDILQVYVWDIASQKNFERLKRNYLSSAHLTIICADVNRATEEYIDPWITDVKDCTDCEARYILSLTKIDLLEDQTEINRIQTELRQKYNTEVIDTSAKTNYNVHELFDTIADKLWSYQ